LNLSEDGVDDRYGRHPSRSHDAPLWSALQPVRAAMVGVATGTRRYGRRCNRYAPLGSALWPLPATW